MDKKIATWPLGMLEIRQTTEAQAAIWRLARPKARSASISLCTARKAWTIRQPRRTAEGKKVNHLPTNAPKIPQQKMEDSLPATTKLRFCFWWKIWWRKFSGEVFGWAPPWKPPHPRSCPQPEFPLPTLSIPLGVVVQLFVMHPWATTATGIALVRHLDFMCRWVDQTLNDREILVIPM